MPLSTPSPDKPQGLELARAIVKAALAKGADQADALLVEDVSVSASCRLGKLEDVERAEGLDAGLRVLIGQRQGIVSANKIGTGSIETLAARAVAMAQQAPEDPFAGLAHRDLLATQVPDLDIHDGQEIDADRLVDRAKRCEAAALAVPGITNSEGSSAGWRRARFGLVTSDGFEGAFESSSHSISASVIAGSGTDMDSDYAYSSRRHFDDLADEEAIGKEAAEKALKKLNPRRVKTTQVPVLFDPRVSNSLLGHFSGAISGSAVARGTSFLKDKLGEKVFGEGIRIIDDPLRKRGLRSRPFDGEGVANEALTLVEEGVLQTWLLETTTAKQLSLRSNGRGSRGPGGLPHPGATNLYLEPGTASPEDMIADIPNGFYITDLIGMGVNPVTGDYSRGAGGFWIENGKLAYPVNELTIAGNLLKMFADLQPASDLRFDYGTNAPTVLIPSLTVAGE